MFVPIQTSRLTLRRLSPEDTQDVYSYRSDPQVSRYQMWKPRSLDDTRQFLEQLAAAQPDTPGTWLQLAIVRRDDNAVIGDCGIRFPDNDSHQAELGISLRPSHQRQGFATEALSAVLAYAFESLHKHRVFASVDPRNLASISLMNRMGMRREGHFRESILIRGEWLDDLIYAMLEHEWANRKR
ncbi:MAG: GNAT family N-acetyltransferase [candidate division Zixibacteria bacterium]|nr:GNAT family N-acetyltransferase [candidate division Zixibacteria bacterium]